MTALATAGSTVMLFSTGRGEPVGSPFVPEIKVTANGQTYEKTKDSINLYVDLARKDNLN